MSVSVDGRNVSGDVFYCSHLGFDDFVAKCNSTCGKPDPNDYQLCICSSAAHNKKVIEPLTRDYFQLGQMDIKPLKFVLNKGCYSDVTEDMVLFRADLMSTYDTGSKRPNNDPLNYRGILTGSVSGLNNLDYFINACINYYNRNNKLEWEMALNTITSFYEKVHCTMEIAEDYLEIARRMLTDQILVVGVHFLNKVRPNHPKKKFSCERWLYDMTQLPPDCVGWGPRDYTIANTNVVTVPKSDVVERPPSGETTDNEDVRTDEDIVATTTSPSGPMFSSSLREVIEEMKTSKKMISQSLAQNLGQGIDSAIKEASSVNPMPVFPVQTMCLLSTGQRLLVHSVNIEHKGARPKIYFHGKCEVRVLPSLNYNLSAHSNLCVDGTVDKKLVERMLAAHVVCMLGVVDLRSDHQLKGGETGMDNAEEDDAYFKP